MVTEFTKLLIERAEKQEKFFKNYLKYANTIKKTAISVVGKVEVWIFGSILRKNELARDIDILIISSAFAVSEKRTEVLVKIWQELGTWHPFEIHLITPEQYEGWYKYFIKEKVKV